MRKRLLASLLAMLMFALGVAVLPQTTRAENNQIKVGEIIYEKGHQMADYWTEDKKTAPVMDEHVFGGWYTSEDGKKFTSLKMDDLDENALPTENVYAKFVPAYVLSIQAQVGEDVTADTASTTIRAVTTVDSSAYGNVGFDVWYNNTIQDTNDLTTTNGYSSLLKEVDGKEVVTTPQQEFGASSKLFVVLKINGIDKSNYSRIIYVRPYWTTLDGTKVEGLGKYMHVEDSYNKNFSVPVNLQTGKEIAAGIVTMTYDKETLELIKDAKTVENGRILKELDYSVDEAKGIITFAANSDSTSVKDIADGVMANVRFRVKADKEAAESYNFTITAGKDTFANWNEKFVDVYAVDYRY